MPDPTLSDAVLEAMTICPTNIREIQTLEIRQPGSGGSAGGLKIAFLIDTTGSMGYLINTLKTAVATLSTDLAATFYPIGFALIDFKDEDQTSILTGSGFTGISTFLATLDTLWATGGSDLPENGYGAVTLACADLAWGAYEGEARAVFLMTDIYSHERGATEANALAALLDTHATFFVGPYTYTGYNNLSIATNGLHLSYTDFADSATLRTSVINALSSLASNSGLDPVYLVNDLADFTAPLVLGGAPVTFHRRCFALNIADSGESGLKGINVTIENADLAVSRYLNLAATFSSPVEITLRVYLSNDLSGPQNNPPITLYLGPIEVSGNSVSSEARWIDIQNAPFPNTYYTRKRFPGL